MGEVYARCPLGIPRPRVGLLSISEEETTGTDLVREAHKSTGNIALKVSEGLVETVEERLRGRTDADVHRNGVAMATRFVASDIEAQLQRYIAAVL